jgi:hypothetical protein
MSVRRMQYVTEPPPPPERRGTPTAHLFSPSFP